MNTPQSLPCSSVRVQDAKSRLTTTALAAVAVVGLAAAAPSAEAAVTVFTLETPITTPQYGMVHFDPYSLFTAQGYNINGFITLNSCAPIVYRTQPTVQFVSLAPTYFEWNMTMNNLPTTLPGGTVVDSSHVYSDPLTGMSDATGQYIGFGFTGQDLYLGYRIISGETIGGYDYGWMKFSYNSNQTVTLTQWAIETGGNGIVVPSAIPEPAAAAALAGLALLGFAATRRRRAA